MEIPVITTDQMREVDRLMIDVYGIKLIQMMENAGRSLAVVARQTFLDSDPIGKSIIVLVGTGGNGGGGLVAARHLHNWGASVQVYTTKPITDISGIPGHQLTILKHMDVPVYCAGEITRLPKSDLILDALIGYSLKGNPIGRSADLIQMANMNSIPILSLDVPSGVDATSGEAYNPHIRASATLTLALPKTGLMKETVKDIVGKLYLADISVPPQLYARLGLEIGSIFGDQEIIQIY